MDLNDPMNNTMIDENNENTENTENNIINDEIVFEENTELSSEEYVIENKSVDESNNENTFSLTNLCNVNNLLLLLAVLGLIYYLFQNDINAFFTNMTGSKNLCA